MYNPALRTNFPACEPNLHCQRAPGHNKPTCMAHYYYRDQPMEKVRPANDDDHHPLIITEEPEPTVVFASLGETCEGFNETTGFAFPSCEPGLECKDKSSTRVSLPGAERKCIDPHAKMIDTDTMPHEGFDPKKYPFLAVEFPFAEPKHVVTDHAEDHYYADPKECEPCKALKEKIETLEQTVTDLEHR